MFNLDKSAVVSLHTLSHLSQSLLMRIQADLYVIEQMRKGKSVTTQNGSDTQYFERCKESIATVSGLLEHLFQLLYFTNQSYVSHKKRMDIVKWWDEQEEELAQLGPDITFKTGVEAQTVELDFPLLEWILKYCVLAAVQWRKNTTQIQVTLSTVEADQFELYFEFIPALEGGQGDPAVSQNETSSLGEFYWVGAQKACELLGARILSQDPHRSGNITLRFDAKE